MDQKKLDARLRASTIVSSLVLIALIAYGIKSKRKGIGYYLLSIFILAPAAGWLTAAISGPLLGTEAEPTKEEPKEETTK